MARALVTGKTMTIGVVFHYIGNPFYDTASNWLNGVWECFRPLDYRMLLAEGDEERPLVGLFRQRTVDGLLLLVPPTSPEDRDQELEHMIKAGFPCVSIGARFKGDVGDYVDTDNFTVAKTMTEKLIKAGHKRIAHISGPHHFNSSALDRLNGYKQALSDHNIPFDDRLILHGNYTADMSYDLMKEALAEGIDCTGIFASNASSAHSAITAIREFGLDVPKDFSVCGIDMPYQSRPIDYELETYQQAVSDIGRQAGEYLLQRIESDDMLESRISFPEGRYIEGNTIRKI